MFVKSFLTFFVKYFIFRLESDELFMFLYIILKSFLDIKQHFML